MAPAGWYPQQDGQLRYWDGQAWTQHFAPAPVRMPTAPPSATAAPPSWVTTPQASGPTFTPANPGPVPRRVEPAGKSTTSRPWFRRKRVLIPTGVLGVLILIGALAPDQPSEPSKVNLVATDAGTSQDDTAAEQAAKAAEEAAAQEAAEKAAAEKVAAEKAAAEKAAAEKVAAEKAAAEKVAAEKAAAEAAAKATAERAAAEAAAKAKAAAAAKAQAESAARARAAAEQQSAARPLAGTGEGSSGACNIKGNIADDGEKIYHVPGGQFYDVTKISPSKGERMFCSEGEAEAAGWRKSKR